MTDEKKQPEIDDERPNDVNDLRFSPSSEVHERRYKIMRLRFVQKWPVSQIATALGLDERKVYRDVAAILKVNGEARRRGQVFKKDTNRLLLEVEATHLERQQQRWQEYHGSKDKGMRRRLLNDIADDEEMHVKMLQSLGVVEKAAERVDVTSTTETWPQKMARLRKERTEAAQAATIGGEENETSGQDD